MITCKYCEKFKINCPKKRKSPEGKVCTHLKRKLILTKEELNEFILSQEKIRSRTAELKLASYIYNQMLQTNPEIATIIKEYNKTNKEYVNYQASYIAWKKKMGKKLNLSTLDKCLIDEYTGTVTTESK